MKKRILSMIICLAMVLALLPAAVFASGSKISIVTVNVPYSLADGKEMFFDNSLITVGDSALYRAYLWGNSWTGPDGIYMPDEYNMPHFKGGERYTLMVLIVPEDGATGLDSSTAPRLPVYINGMRARFNPACSPWLEEAPYKTTYAYEIDLQCPYTNEIDIVEIFGFTPPTPGAVPCDINDLSVPENAPYYISGVTWERYLGVPPTSGARDMAAGETFTDGVYYFLYVTLCPYDGYTFSAGDVTWRINGTSYNGYIDSYSYVSAPTAAILYSADLKAESRHIDYIDIEGLGGFYEGAAAKTAFENVTAPDAEGYTLYFDEDTVISSESNNHYINATDVFQSGETYRATFCARPDPGWTIDDSTVWRINGSTDLVQYARNTGDHWYVKSIPIAPAANTPIKEVYIYGYETPEVDQTAGDCLNMFTVGDLYEFVDAYWFCDTINCRMGENEVFEADKLYSACVIVKSRDPAFTINDTTVFYLNGGEFAVELSGARLDGSYYVWTEQMEAITPTLTHIVSWYLDPADDFAVTGVEVEDGEVFGEPAAPAKDGYTFGGWFTDRACTVPYDPNAPIHEDIELFPLWIPAPVGTPITAVDAQIPVPVAGQEPAGTASVTLTSTPEGAPLSVSALTWFYWDDTLSAENKWMYVPESDYVFEAGETYAVDIFACVEEGSDYVFDPAVVGTVNGQPSDDSYDDLWQSESTVYLSYVWVAQETPCEHTNTELHNEKAATCTESGYSGDLYCFHCGQLLTKGEIIPALGHDYVDADEIPATCTQAGFSAGSRCSRCGDYQTGGEPIPALGHDFVGGTCSRCGAKDPNYKPIEPDKPCDGGASCPGKSFTDMPKPNNWAHAGIDFCVERGLFGGTTETTFEPETQMNRAMLVTVLWRYEGKPLGFTNTFNDVAEGEWYTDAVSWAAAKGVVNGVEDGRFNPEGTVTREQMAAILYRYSEYKNYDTTKRADFSDFPDAGSVSDWAQTAMQWAVAEKLIGGSQEGGKTYILPGSGATRAQVATILMRFVQNIAEK